METTTKKKATNKFSPEVRARAVRMVREHRGDHSSQWATIASIAAKIGCTCSATIMKAAYRQLDWPKLASVE